MRLYAQLDDNTEERELFINKILSDYESGFEMIEALFGSPAKIRRDGQYDNLKWRDNKLKTLHTFHLYFLKQWRQTPDKNPHEKEKLLTKLLSIINSMSSGLKNTG